MLRPAARALILFGCALPLTLAGAVAAHSIAPSASAPLNVPAPPPLPIAPVGPTRAEKVDRLRKILQLHPDQEAALQAYVQALEYTGRNEDAQRLLTESRDKSLPYAQRLEKIIAYTDASRASLAALLAATKAFYAQLTPPQQQAFDVMN